MLFSPHREKPLRVPPLRREIRSALEPEFPSRLHAEAVAPFGDLHGAVPVGPVDSRGPESFEGLAVRVAR